MKKIIIMLLVLLMMCGCASSSASQENAQNDQSDPFDAGKLSFEYFDEFYAQLMYEGLPEDRVSLPLGNANGIWKYDLKIRRDSSANGYLFDELGYAEMSVHNNDNPPVKIVLHPRLASEGNETREETDEEVGYEPFGGVFDENNVLKLTGNGCVLILERYYEWQGKEYLSATMQLSEEESGSFMMIREKSVPEISGSGDDQAIVGDLPEYSGNSAAFTSSPCEGVTVSAEEGAFKEDTVVSFTKLDEMPEKFKELEAELIDQWMIPVYAWEVDAGLEDNEIIPGAFEVEIDLEEIGIDQAFWPDLSVIRIADDGDYYEYAPTIEGNKLVYLSRQNSLTAICVGTCLPGWNAVLEGWDSISENMYFFSRRDYLGNYVDYIKCQNQYGSYEIQWSTKEYSPENSDKVQRLHQLEEEFEQEGKNFYKMMGGTGGLTENMEIALNCKLRMETSPEYLNLKKEIPIPDSILQTQKLIDTAYTYLGGVQKVRMPNTKVVFMARSDGLTPENINKLGDAEKINYVSVINIWPHKSLDTKEKIDNFLLTITHELFHVCQERYRFAADYIVDTILVDDPRYDEMVTMVLERDAKEYYKQSGVITTNPGLTEKDQWYALRLPIDQSPKSEGGADNSADRKTLLMREGYLLGDFVMYLQKQFPKANATPHELMKARSYFYQSAVSTPLRTVFGLTEAEFDTYFRKWIMSNEQSIQKEIVQHFDNTTYYRKEWISVSPGNSYHVTLDHDGSYFMSLRGFRRAKFGNLPAIVILDKDFRKNHSSIVLLTFDNEDAVIPGGAYYKTINQEIIGEVYGKIEAGEDMNVSYTLWAFGKTPPPSAVKEDQNDLIISLPEMSDMAKAGLVDGYLMRISKDGTIIHEEDISIEKYKENPSYTLEKFLKKHPKGEKEDLAVTLCEYIKDVDGNKCPGIESDPIHSTKGDVNICTIVYTERKTKVTYYITVEGGVVYGVYEGNPNWPADEQDVGIQVKPYEKIRITVEASDGWLHVLPQNIEGEETRNITLQSGESWEIVPRRTITQDDKYSYFCQLVFYGHVGDPNGEHSSWFLPKLRFNGVEEYTKTPLNYYEVKTHING